MLNPLPGSKLSEHLNDVFFRELFHETFFRGNQFLGEFQLLLLKCKDFLLYCISCDELVSEYFSLLANAMCAVNGLGFNGGIPPRIQDENIIGFCKIRSEERRVGKECRSRWL